MNKCFNNIYQGKKVLVTGHTGFKGSWLVFWLKNLGADVIGYSLKPGTNPNHHDLLKSEIVSIYDDVRNRRALMETFTKYQPDIVFHMAAQALVRYSYAHPHETFETNVMGTLNVYDAARQTPSVKAIVNITSDKCYENKEWVWGYRESDPMGGYDPYSASKGCAELLTSSYRNSYFNVKDFNTKHEVLLASVRAGNVIGGGDWAEDRLIPDIIKATVKNEAVVIRNPQATRPWQHVLEPLSGYLLVGQRLLEKYTKCADAYNFGPNDEGALTVGQVTTLAKSSWDRINHQINQNPQQLHEAHYLKLDCSKAHIDLGWKPVWESSESVARTISWYKNFYNNNTLTTQSDLEAYLQSALKQQQIWIAA